MIEGLHVVIFGGIQAHKRVHAPKCLVSGSFNLQFSQETSKRCPLSRDHDGRHWLGILRTKDVTAQSRLRSVFADTVTQILTQRVAL
jgi:hypothetical protein